MAPFNFNPQQFGQMMKNPVQFLANRKFNVPQNIGNDPKAIIQHLMNTGQMSQTTYNNLNSFRNEFESRLSNHK